MEKKKPYESLFKSFKAKANAAQNSTPERKPVPRVSDNSISTAITRPEPGVVPKIPSAPRNPQLTARVPYHLQYANRQRLHAIDPSTIPIIASIVRRKPIARPQTYTIEPDLSSSDVEYQSSEAGAKDPDDGATSETSSSSTTSEDDFPLPITKKKKSKETHITGNQTYRASAKTDAKPPLVHPTIPSLSDTESSPPRIPVPIRTHRVVYDFYAKPIPKKTVAAAKPNRNLRARMIERLLGFNEMGPTKMSVTVQVLEDHVGNMGFKNLLRQMAATQTGLLDASCEIETQTETPKIKLATKWTQLPPKLSALTVPNSSIEIQRMDYRIRKMEMNGVGYDPLPTAENLGLAAEKLKECLTIDPLNEESRLLTFLKKATKMMSSVLDVVTLKEVSSSVLGGDPDETLSLLEFSRGISALESLNMQSLYCEGSHVALANLPRAKPESDLIVPTKQMKNIITIWHVNNPVLPLYFLRVWGEVTCIRTIFPTGIVIAGTHNGIINIWDLQEDEKHHSSYQHICVRTPTFHSGGLEGSNHQTRIIAMDILPESSSSAQILTLDKQNNIICWSCIRNPVGIPNTAITVNTVLWSNIRVRVLQVLILRDIFASTFLVTNCLSAWEDDQKYFVVGTNNGFIGKARIAPDSLNTNIERFGLMHGTLMRIHSVDVNPRLNLLAALSSDNYFRIFEMSRQRAILLYDCGEKPIKILWSHQRISVFYVSFSDHITVWDLVVSDLESYKKCPAKGLKDFHLAFAGTSENLILITHYGIKVYMVVPPYDLTPLTANHEKLLRHYISVIN